MLNIITFILLNLITLWLFYISYRVMRKSIETFYEKLIYLAVIISVFFLIFIYLLDRYNIPTELDWYINVDISNWFDAIISYSTTIISVFMSSVVSMCVVMYQIRKNKEENIENQRIQNMPILKYYIDAEKKEDIDQDKTIVTNITNGYVYNLNISIKNIGINSIKNIKVDFRPSIINDSIYRVLGKNSLEVLEKGEKIEINEFLPLKISKETYEMSIIVYYEDVLSNWYRQILDVKYTVTDIHIRGYIGIVDYKVNKEELIKEEDIESKVL